MDHVQQNKNRGFNLAVLTLPFQTVTNFSILQWSLIKFQILVNYIHVPPERSQIKIFKASENVFSFHFAYESK